MQSIEKQNKLIGNTPHYTVSPTSFPILDSSSGSMANNYNGVMNGSYESTGDGGGLNRTSRGYDNGDRDGYTTGTTKQLKRSLNSSSSNNIRRGNDSRDNNGSNNQIIQDNKTLYLSTLKNLDSYFDNPYRRDLVAATIPPGSEQLQRWTAASNDICAQSSKQWTLKLRK